MGIKKHLPRPSPTGIEQTDVRNIGRRRLAPCQKNQQDLLKNQRGQLKNENLFNRGQLGHARLGRVIFVTMGLDVGNGGAFCLFEVNLGPQ